MASLKPLLSIFEFLHTDISLYIPSVTATSKNRNFRSKKQVAQKWTLLEKQLEEVGPMIDIQFEN